jgi:hypothetical protein
MTKQKLHTILNDFTAHLSVESDNPTGYLVALGEINTFAEQMCVYRHE